MSSENAIPSTPLHAKCYAALRGEDMKYEYGVYWVWFYNHDEPRMMKYSKGGWESFRSDSYVHDEIDFTENKPLRVEMPVVA